MTISDDPMHGMNWSALVGGSWHPLVLCDPAPFAARGPDLSGYRSFTLTWPTTRYMTEGDLGL